MLPFCSSSMLHRTGQEGQGELGSEWRKLQNLAGRLFLLLPLPRMRTVLALACAYRHKARRGEARTERAVYFSLVACAVVLLVVGNVWSTWRRWTGPMCD